MKIKIRIEPEFKDECNNMITLIDEIQQLIYQRFHLKQYYVTLCQPRIDILPGFTFSIYLSPNANLPTIP